MAGLEATGGYAFWLDLLTRATGQASMLYDEITPDCLCNEPRFRAWIEAAESRTGIFKSTRQRIREQVRLSHQGSEHGIAPPEFHWRYGWIARAGKLEAHLGKVILGGAARIVIGPGSYLSGASEVTGAGSLRIGAWCAIATDQLFATEDMNHQTRFPSVFNFANNYRFPHLVPQMELPHYTGDKESRARNGIVIGSDVWVGRGCCFLAGAEVGHGVALGTGSLVSRELEPYGVYAGRPARLLRFRCSPTQRAELLRGRWWEWSFEEISRNREFFDTALDPERPSESTGK